MRSIKRLVITLAGVILLSVPSMAQPAAQEHPVQPDPENKEKLESARIAYLTTCMDLTPEEATKFWPVYNEYCKVISEARKVSRKQFHEIQRMTDGKNTSEAAMKKQLMDYIDGLKKDDELERLYLDEFLKILPVEKVALMYVAEEDFRIKMIKMWKKPGMEKGTPGPGKHNSKPAAK